MATFPTPIQAKPAERDPLRNFKFRVEFFHPDQTINQRLGAAGFISVSGMGMQTDMIPYREGGDNTAMRKLPGQSDFGQLTLVQGVFIADKNAGATWMKQIFSVVWGKGSAGYNDEFRADVIVSVLKHPVTRFSAGAAGDPNSASSAGMAVKFYNCWPGSLQFNDLNAGDNSIMIANMVLHHEGFEPLFGTEAQARAFAV